LKLDGGRASNGLASCFSFGSSSSSSSFFGFFSAFGFSSFFASGFFSAGFFSACPPCGAATTLACGN